MNLALSGQVFGASGVQYTYPDGSPSDKIWKVPTIKDPSFLASLNLDECFSLFTNQEGLYYSYITKNASAGADAYAMVTLFTDYSVPVDGGIIIDLLSKSMDYFITKGLESVDDININEVTKIMFPLETLRFVNMPVVVKTRREVADDAYAYRRYNSRAELASLFENPYQSEYADYSIVLFVGADHHHAIIPEEYTCISSKIIKSYIIKSPATATVDRQIAYDNDTINVTFKYDGEEEVVKSFCVGQNSPLYKISGRDLIVIDDEVREVKAEVEDAVEEAEPEEPQEEQMEKPQELSEETEIEDKELPEEPQQEQSEESVDEPLEQQIEEQPVETIEEEEMPEELDDLSIPVTISVRDSRGKMVEGTAYLDTESPLYEPLLIYKGKTLAPEGGGTAVLTTINSKKRFKIILITLLVGLLVGYGLSSIAHFSDAHSSSAADSTAKAASDTTATALASAQSATFANDTLADLDYLKTRDIWDCSEGGASIRSQKYKNFMEGVRSCNVAIYGHTEIENTTWQTIIAKDPKNKLTAEEFFSCIKADKLDLNQLLQLLEK